MRAIQASLSRFLCNSQNICKWMSAAPRPRGPFVIPKAIGQSQKRSLFARKRKAPPTRLGSALWTATGLVVTGGFLYYAHDTRAGIHSWLAIPVLHALTADDPEKSHKIAIKVLESGLAPKDKGQDDPVLSFELWGRKFSNPVGMAAGFDKHGEAIDGIFDLGFGYVEIGSVTPVPQPGNPQPRFFRLPSSESVINRYGFNSEGHLAVLGRLRTRIRHFVQDNSHLLPPTLFPILPAGSEPDPRPLARLLSSEAGQDAIVPDLLSSPRSLHPGKVLAINLGKNKLSAPEAIDDFVNGVAALGPYADVLVVNVSSPNTPGLRTLQKKGTLEDLLSSVVSARNDLKSFRPPVVVKIAPDITPDELDDIASAAMDTKIDGIIVSNTTISRPHSAGNDPQITEQGGLSGPPLKPLSLTTLASLYRSTGGKIPLIGCGGISTGQDALDYAKAGASFVQLYTALGYQGVGLPRKIKDQLTTQLKKDGTTWSKVVGSGVKMPSQAELEQEALQKKQKVEQREKAAFNASIAELKGELDQVMKQIAEEESKAEAMIAQPMPEVLVQESGEAAPAQATSGNESGASSGVTDASSSATPASPQSSNGEKKDDKKQPFVFSVPLQKLGSSFGQRGKAATEGKRLV